MASFCADAGRGSGRPLRRLRASTAVLQLPTQVHQFALLARRRPCACGGTLPTCRRARWIRCRSGSRADAKDLVVVRTAEPALGPELHVLYPAGGAGQSRQLVGQRADVLADQGLQDGRQVQLLMLDQLLLLGTRLAQMEFLLLAVDDVRSDAPSPVCRRIDTSRASYLSMNSRARRRGLWAMLLLARPSNYACSSRFRLSSSDFDLVASWPRPRNLRDGRPISDRVRSCISSDSDFLRLRQAARRFAAMARVAVDILQQRQQIVAKNFVVVRTAEPAAIAKVDELDAAMGALGVAEDPSSASTARSGLPSRAGTDLACTFERSSRRNATLRISPAHHFRDVQGRGVRTLHALMHGSRILTNSPKGLLVHSNSGPDGLSRNGRFCPIFAARTLGPMSLPG